MNVDPARMQVSAQEASRLLKALANEQRLMILCQLTEGERSVSELGSRVTLSQSALSQHLARLREDGLVATRRESQTIYYRLASKAAEAVIQTLYRTFCRPASGRGGTTRSDRANRD